MIRLFETVSRIRTNLGQFKLGDIDGRPHPGRVDEHKKPLEGEVSILALFILHKVRL